MQHHATRTNSCVLVAPTLSLTERVWRECSPLSFATTTSNTTTPRQASAITALQTDPLSQEYILVGTDTGRIQLFGLQRLIQRFPWDSHYKRQAQTFLGLHEAVPPIELPLVSTSPSPRTTTTAAISSLAWYPLDSGLFTATDVNNTLSIYDSNSLSRIAILPAPEPILDLHVHAHNGLIAIPCRGPSGDILLCDLKNSSLTHRLFGHAGNVSGPATSRRETLSDVITLDLHTLASSTLQGGIHVWDLRKAQKPVLHWLAEPPSRGVAPRIEYLYYLPHQATLFAQSYSGHKCLYSWQMCGTGIDPTLMNCHQMGGADDTTLADTLAYSFPTHSSRSLRQKSILIADDSSPLILSAAQKSIYVNTVPMSRFNGYEDYRSFGRDPERRRWRRAVESTSKSTKLLHSAHIRPITAISCSEKHHVVLSGDSGGNLVFWGRKVSVRPKDVETEHGRARRSGLPFVRSSSSSSVFHEDMASWEEENEHFW